MTFFLKKEYGIQIVVYVEGILINMPIIKV